MADGLTVDKGLDGLGLGDTGEAWEAWMQQPQDEACAFLRALEAERDALRQRLADMERGHEHQINRATENAMLLHEARQKLERYERLGEALTDAVAASPAVVDGCVACNYRIVGNKWEHADDCPLQAWRNRDAEVPG